jgi:hypothetical protein
MKNIAALLFCVAAIVAGSAIDGNSTPSIFSSINASDAENADGISASLIKGIQVFGKSSGIAYTSHALYRTDDNGETWTELPLPRHYRLRLTYARFTDEKSGIALFADQASSRLSRFDTANGGSSWMQVAMNDDHRDIKADLTNAALDSAKVRVDDNGNERLEFRLTTSSNFHQTVSYLRKPGEMTWGHRSLYEKDTKHEERYFSLKEEWEDFYEVLGRAKSDGLPEDPVITRLVNSFHGPEGLHSSWYLTQNGSCAGVKTGCVLTTKLYKKSADAENASIVPFKEITPPEIVTLNRAAKDAAQAEAARSQMFALPPGGSTRTSLNRGFDKCQAGSVAQMQLWWDNSYFFDSNIYFSGRNRACPVQPFTNNPAWIDQVSAMGWGLIPTVVGYQSPCTSSATTAKLSYDPVLAEQQGRGEADIAVADAASIGLTAGSVLYYDMERYDPPSPDTLGCRTATVAFLKGWTERIRELGYKSGTYGSPKNAQEDWQFMAPASRMDAIWMARWDNIPSVWTYVTFPTFPTNVWNNHQRIKQWQQPHNETWAGVTFNIDGNISDGPVAGIPVPKNKVADFDGDGKTDVSVFRPSNGHWYISGTRGPTFTYSEFGVSTDILTPGDFDGDGKTDHAVFRPGDSTWYIRMKGNFTARNFGVLGDIPAAADYNGDGKADIAVFRPSNGTWYIAYSDSLNSFGELHFGQDGDKPVPADYDGDGKADIAIWRPADGMWHVQGTAGNYFNAHWGVAGDLPAQADYDGDGKVDFAVFRGGTWYILQTTGGIFSQNFGVEGDVPSTGDFDGDGLYDIAVFRPSNGTWYMSQSQGGYVVREFGVLNDKPIPAAYLPQ